MIVSVDDISYHPPASPKTPTHKRPLSASRIPHISKHHLEQRVEKEENAAPVHSPEPSEDLPSEVQLVSTEIIEDTALTTRETINEANKDQGEEFVADIIEEDEEQVDVVVVHTAPVNTTFHAEEQVAKEPEFDANEYFATLF